MFVRYETQPIFLNNLINHTIKISMLQTVPSHKFYASYEYQNYTEQPRQALNSNSKQSFLSLKNSSNMNDEDSLTITPFDKDTRIITNLTSRAFLNDQAQEIWPQIDSIVKKIKSLQLKLRNQRKITMELNQKIREFQNSTLAVEEERKRTADQATAYQENFSQLEARVKQLQNILSEKDEQLLEKQQLIQNIQFSQLKKNTQNEDKIRKLNLDIKDFMDKLRKSKLQIQKQRKSYQQLKTSMTSQLQQVQSQKDSYLFEELQRLKAIIENSKQQRQIILYRQIDELNRKVYVQQQEIKKKNIEISIAERKKQQAVNDIMDKKDQQIKVQKALSKALNDKMTKLQEQIKAIKTQNNDFQRNNKRVLRNATNRSNIQEQISFELSPEKV